MMLGQNFDYHGNVKIYLQGRKALEVREQSPTYFSYYLGSEKSRILVRDFRQDVYLAAERAILGEDLNEFADIFNQPARVWINIVDDNIQIDLYGDAGNNSEETLWLGVVKDGNKLPVVYANWEVYRELNDSRTGFVALVPD